MKSFLIASCLAMAGAASPSLAQMSDAMPDGIAIRALGPESVLNHNSYSGRANVLVYSTGLPQETGGGFAGPGADANAVLRVLGDDLNFTPGPGAAGGFSINGLAFGYWAAVNNTTDIADFRFTFYSTYDPNGNPVNGGTVIGQIVIRAGGLLGANGQGAFFPDPIALNAVGQVVIPPGTGTIFVYSDVVDDSTLPNPTLITGINTISRANHVWQAGSSDGYRYFTQNGDLVINPADRTPGVPPVIPTNSRSLYLKLQADIGVTRPAIDFNFNCLTDGTTSHNFTLAANDAYWTSFCLNNQATDFGGTAGTFLDADTEGSTAGAALGFFNMTTGELIAADIVSSGSGTNAQLSAGIGRRAAVGDGVQYDGRVEPVARGLAAGTYDMAIAPAGSTFSDGWIVNASGAGGAVTVNVNTNNNSGALAPSVTPIVNEDFGQPLAPGAQATSAAVGAFQIIWYHINICQASSDAEPIEFSFATTPGNPAPSSALHIFNASGNRVASTVSPNTTLAAPIVFNGTNVLPAGDYWFSVSYSAAQLSQNPDTAGRFHVRAANGDNGFALQAQVLLAYAACPGPTCDPDFNCDGNADQDDVSCMINVVAGNPGCECQDPDFNSDGNVDQDDVAALINVVAGGNCP